MGPSGSTDWYQYDPAEETFQRYVPREEKETGPSEEDLKKMADLQNANDSLSSELENKNAQILSLQQSQEASGKTISQAKTDMNRIRIIAIAMTGLCLFELIVFFAASAISRAKRKKRLAAKKAQKAAEEQKAE